MKLRRSKAALLGAAALYVLWCWWPVVFMPSVENRTCWDLQFQDGSHQRVCGDRIATTPPDGNYFTVTVYDAADTVVGTFTWVYKLRKITP